MTTEVEYVQALRAACNKIIYARDRDADMARLAMVDALLQFLAMHERYTGAQVGVARSLKPLLMAAFTAAQAGEDFWTALVHAIEQQHNLPPTRRERGWKYIPRAERL